MDIYKLKKLPSEERKTILEGESATTEEQTYQIPCDDIELATVKDDLSQASVKKSYIEEEFRVIKDGFKERLEPLMDQIKESITTLKSRAKTVTGIVYNIPDFDNKMMHSVDASGNVLNSRPLKPEERQYHITQQSKQA